MLFGELHGLLASLRPDRDDPARTGRVQAVGPGWAVRVRVPVGLLPFARRNVKVTVPAGGETSVMTPSGQFARPLAMVWSRVTLRFATATMASLPEQLSCG